MSDVNYAIFLQVFGSFNDSQVHPIQLKSYGTWRHLEKYPQVDEIRYPKAGTTNPECQLWRVDLSGETAETRQISPPASLGQGAGGEAPHFSGIKFVNSDTFAVKWMNRVQTKTVVTLCQTKGSGECKEVFANYEREGSVVVFTLFSTGLGLTFWSNSGGWTTSTTSTSEATEMRPGW